MTPKEKAKELIDTFTFSEIYFTGGKETMLINARNCSLLCVDELIEQISPPRDDWFEERLEYLEKVKDELHQL